MSNINKRLNELSPHVLGIRFTKGIAVIDTFFKEGWSLPKSDTVGYEPVPTRENIFMLWPQNEKVGVDEMLDYVAYVIKVNIEREQKIELLQVKINELKEIFTNSPLTKCRTLKFSFQEDMTPTTINDSDIDLPIMSGTDSVTQQSSSNPHVYGKNNPVKKENVVTESDLDDVPVAEVPRNDSEVEGFNKQARVGNQVVHLPTTKNGKIVPEIFDEPEVVCKCDPNDPNQACPICIDDKF
jgi:hypothetical protein